MLLVFLLLLAYGFASSGVKRYVEFKFGVLTVLRRSDVLMILCFLLGLSDAKKARSQ